MFEGWIQLTKFHSNSKRVLLSIPKEHRKVGMKNEDLLGNLPEEQALSVLWKTEEDLLGLTKFPSRTNQ